MHSYSIPEDPCSILVALKVAEDSLQDLCHLILGCRIELTTASSAGPEIRAARVGWRVLSEQVGKSGAGRCLLGAFELLEQALQCLCAVHGHGGRLLDCLLTDRRLCHRGLLLDKVLVAGQLRQDASKNLRNLVPGGGGDVSYAGTVFAVAERARVIELWNRDCLEKCRLSNHHKGADGPRI